MNIVWTKTQLIESGIEIAPLWDKTQCDEWVLKSEAESNIMALKHELESCARNCDYYHELAMKLENRLNRVKKALLDDVVIED